VEASAHAHSTGFRHEAMFYAGEDEFVDRAAGFIADGLASGEAVLVAVSAAKITRLREALGGAGDQVQFADMGEIGANPARIIPVWEEFADMHLGGGRRARGMGEPISAARDPAELVECQRHESLLNVAFAPGPGWRLVCPYDTSTLAPAVIDEARRSHPLVGDALGVRTSDAYVGYEAIAAPFADPLPEPPGPVDELRFDLAGLRAVRVVTADLAARSGLGEDRGRDLVMAVNEVASNSVRHAGGDGLLRMWADAGAVICEVRDRGYLDKPLAGRRRPRPDQVGGHGLWLANQLCDLVQVRSSPEGTVIRLHMRLTGVSRARG
jgi:anti-sigma regulatory factor (Ser/Thr protein kinase)